MRRDQRKGIFCLEGDWWGVKDSTTVEPVLRLLETAADYRVPYIHRDVGTRSEFDFYLKKWKRRSMSRFPHPLPRLSRSQGTAVRGRGPSRQDHAHFG